MNNKFSTPTSSQQNHYSQTAHPNLHNQSNNVRINRNNDFHENRNGDGGANVFDTTD